MHTYKHAVHCRLANDISASERAAAWQAKTKKAGDPLNNNTYEENASSDCACVRVCVCLPVLVYVCLSVPFICMGKPPA